MKNAIFPIFTLGILLIIVACQPQAPHDSNNEDIREASNGSPPKVSITVEDDIYDTLLGSYCWELANGRKNERTVECVDKETPEVLLENTSSIIVKPNTKGKLSIDYPSPPTDIDLSLLQTGEMVDITVSDQTISFPSEQGNYHYIAWLRWEDEGEVVNEASYVFAIKVE